MLVADLDLHSNICLRKFVRTPHSTLDHGSPLDPAADWKLQQL